MSHITSISDKALKLIKDSEGWSAKPYRDAVGIPTIGYGATFWENGTRVSMADKAITPARGESLLRVAVSKFEKEVDSFTNDDITQGMFDALVVFAYNVGSRALKGSTLLKKVNSRPLDTAIRAEFAKWVYADGKKLNGLVTRRKAEADLYFS